MLHFKTCFVKHETDIKHVLKMPNSVFLKPHAYLTYIFAKKYELSMRA